jgi:hypothetical protein
MMNRFHPIPEAHVPYGTHLNSVHVSAPVTIFSAILFLSGIGALIFETLWLRLSGLVRGEIRSGNQPACLAANVSVPLRAQDALPFQARVDCHFERNEE